MKILWILRILNGRRLVGCRMEISSGKKEVRVRPGKFGGANEKSEDDYEKDNVENNI